MKKATLYLLLVVSLLVVGTPAQSAPCIGDIICGAQCDSWHTACDLISCSNQCWCKGTYDNCSAGIGCPRCPDMLAGF